MNNILGKEDFTMLTKKDHEVAIVKHLSKQSEITNSDYAKTIKNRYKLQKIT